MAQPRSLIDRRKLDSLLVRAGVQPKSSQEVPKGPPRERPRAPGPAPPSKPAYEPEVADREAETEAVAETPDGGADLTAAAAEALEAGPDETEAEEPEAGPSETEAIAEEPEAGPGETEAIAEEPEARPAFSGWDSYDIPGIVTAVPPAAPERFDYRTLIPDFGLPLEEAAEEVEVTEEEMAAEVPDEEEEEEVTAAEEEEEEIPEAEMAPEVKEEEEPPEAEMAPEVKEEEEPPEAEMAPGVTEEAEGEVTAAEMAPEVKEEEEPPEAEMAPEVKEEEKEEEMAPEVTKGEVTIPEFPIPEDDPRPLDARLADLLAWFLAATGATAAFVADDAGIPLVNQGTPGGLIAAVPVLGETLAGLEARVPELTKASLALELRDQHVLQIIWAEAEGRTLAAGLVSAEPLSREMVNTVRSTLRRATQRRAGVVPVPPRGTPSRGTRLIAFVRQFAPTPEAALRRIATRTGIPRDALETPDQLRSAEIELVEEAIRDVLGLETIDV